MLEVFIDALIDSAKVLIVLIFVNIFISFFEVKISKKIKKDNKLSPLYASLFGIIPQCGVSVVGADLYVKRHITIGTLIALFLACSDEAIPLLLGSLNQKSLYIIPLIITKIIVGFVVGFLVDFVLTKRKKEVVSHLENCQHHDEVHVGCCHHHIDEDENKWREHLIHPLFHSLKLFIYILIINIIFGVIIYYVKEETISNFIISNRYIAPIFATIVGLIPNCVSSVILVELFLLNNLSFGALVAGLLMNAGLGVIVLLKNKDMKKDIIFIVLLNFIISILVGYLVCLVTGF